MTLLKLIFRLFTLSKLWRLARALRRHGTNVMALLAYAASNAPEKKAIEDEQEEINYTDLYRQTAHLAWYLKEAYHLKPGDHVLLIGRNSISYIKSIFALSNLGVHTSLVNPGLNRAVYEKFLAQKKYSLVICDKETDLSGEHVPVPLLYSDHASQPGIRKLAEDQPAAHPFLKTKKPGNIIVLTSGSTGTPKEAKRKPSVTAFIDPVLDLTEKLGIQKYDALFIAVPVFHGFGLAALFMACFFSKTMYVRRRFRAEAVVQTIAKYDIECIALVPLMLQKLTEETWPAQSPVTCIISGGDKLNPELVKRSSENLGDVLYNLYGTSEAGVCVLATPADLKKFPDTIGQKIRGTRIRIRNKAGKACIPEEVGELCVSAGWAMEGAETFIGTGDLAWQNAEGFYFLKGRKDDMIIIGGENIFPIELEHVVYQHPCIAWVKAEGFEDEQGNKQLKLKIVICETHDLTAEQMTAWLETRIPRHLKPALIEVLDQQPVSKLM
jgi:acyl-CoA synthetase (AMP-forming)/AMP-acid ligase II